MSPIKIEQASGAIVGSADQDYFLDDEGNVTTDDEKAATLLIRKGQNVPKEMADKYGIGKVAQTEEGAAAEEASEPETVKAEKPASNKAKKPAANKGAK